jgi:hypothetical protein
VFTLCCLDFQQLHRPLRRLALNLQSVTVRPPEAIRSARFKGDRQ